METNYTPGPWTFGGDGYEFDAEKIGWKNPLRTLCVDNKNHNTVVHVVGWSEESKANARLVAAAPDLLESLMQLVEQMESQRGDWLNTDSARAAIAKATAR